MAMEKFRHSPLPQPQQEFDQHYIRQLVRSLEVYFTQLDSLTPNQAESYRADAFYGGVYRGRGQGLVQPYALLMSTEDQASAGTTSENLLTYNQTVEANDVRVENGSQIKFTHPGSYLVTVSLQMTNRGNAVQEIELWAKNTGANYPLSNTRFDITARKSESVWAHVVADISGVFTVTDPATEYLEMAWWSDGADVFVEYYEARSNPARPAIPAVIATVSFVSALPEVI